MKCITDRTKRWGRSGRKYLQCNDYGFSSGIYKEFLQINKKKACSAIQISKWKEQVVEEKI